MWRRHNLLDIFRKICYSSDSHRMPQKNKRSKETKNDSKKEENEQIFLNKDNNIIVQVLAKPGAKHNGITGITEEGVGIQISAPPSDGEANTELVKYVSSVLGMRKNDVVFEKGFKSRSKTLKIVGNITVDEVKKKINDEINS